MAARHHTPVARICRGLAAAIARARCVHGDERGTISILSTFALLMLTMLLLLVTNVAQQVDDKVQMQNAVDSASYSGGVVLARGMNAIAFANHLECDVLAITAFLREARDRNAEQLVPEVLDAWRDIAAKFAPAEFEKFIPLPEAIPAKAQLEQELVTAWGDMANSAAEFALPVFEYILGTPQNVQDPVDDHLLPNFQRDVLENIPRLAQEVTNEVALRHGLPSRRRRGVSGQLRDNPQSASNDRGPQYGVLWRTNVEPVGIADETDPMTRTLPVVDPDPSQSDYFRVPNGQSYLDESVQRRNSLTRTYLEHWIQDDNLFRGLGFFGDEAKMSQFQALYRIAACAYLWELLNEEYPTTNVPMMIRRDFGAGLEGNQVLDEDYSFVGVAYRPHVPEMAPKMYANPIDEAADAVTFAQISLYLPRRMYTCCPWARPWYDRDGNVHWSVYTNGWPSGWDLFNQNWTVRLTPAVTDSLPSILHTNPGGYASSVRPPDLGGAGIRDIDAVSTH